MSDIILSTDGVSKSFGKFLALNNVSVAFERGKLSAIIGPNGAGKSTYFNVLSGAFPPSAGRLTYEGRDITGLAQHEFARIGIAKSFQITNVFPKLSAFENVRVAVQARHARFGLWRPRHAYEAVNERARQLLALVGLAHHAERPAQDMAHGEQRALEMGMALAAEPKLLLLDEPTAGMSPEETRTMMDLIQRLAQDRTVILVEHKMKLVMGICERIVVLHHGELLADGTPAEVQNNADVKRVYLGQGKSADAAA
ncbi:ABC transporter ATP-binding protein [Ferrovibrio sp.]|uniref:ABC transporter ATP-binding protein n=1 Tax=Ferrovibrio sp. TaxID=1917215 RepID=UPI001B710E77|nr:ABC transporter ATP-binding protein [Ferrovibrio sp.]MBP7063841.1 ABC transporter ATP-binding protein [Ferrovibrio sp.]